MPLFARRFGHLGTENAFKIGEDVARARARGVDVIPFTIGEPDFDSAPHINEAGIAAIRRGDTHYTDPAGIAPLREALATHVSRTRGIDVTADRIIVLPGAKPAIGYTMMAYVDPGDEVIYPSPGFPIYESWVTYLGGVPKPLVLREERGFSFTVEDLDRLLTEKTKVLMLCSPSNPTGGVLPRSLLTEVADLVRERARPDIRIYSDEIYEHITFDGFEHTSMASLPGMNSRTIIASGHSKGYAMTGWRLGWCVLPTTEEALRFKQININTVSCVPPFIQEAAREALESPKTAGVVGFHGGRVQAAPRLRGAGAERRPGDPLRESSGRLLRVSEHLGRLRIPGSHGVLRVAAGFPEGGNQSCNPGFPVPSLLPRGRPGGPPQLRRDRQRGTALPSSLLCGGHGFAPRGNPPDRRRGGRPRRVRPFPP